MELKKGRFYTVILECEGFFSKARAKDVDIVKNNDEDVLVFYDCTCGVRKEIPGKIEKNDNNEIIFSVSDKKKYIVREISI